MNEALAKLTQTVEEKDLQIDTLVNRLEKKNNDKERGSEEEEPLTQEIEEKPDQATTLVGSLSIQQLQQMIVAPSRHSTKGVHIPPCCIRSLTLRKLTT